MQPFVIKALLTFLTSAILAAALAPAAAQSRPATLTPDEAVALALENHPLLRAAGEDVAAANADQRLAKSGYVPRLDLTEDWVRSNNPVFVFASKLGQERFGMSDFALDALNSPDPFTNAATRVSLKQNIWDAGRTIKGMEAAKRGVAASQESLQRTREAIAFGARRAFWDTVLADEFLKVTQAAEDAAKANADLASNQVEAGLGVPSDRMSADVRLAEVRAMRIRAAQGAHVARAALRQALGLSEDRVFTLDPPPPDPRACASEGGGDPEAAPAGRDEDETAAVHEALAARADLKALDERIAQAGIGEKIARSGYYPEIGLGAQYEWNGASLFGSDGRNWTVGAAVRFSVFDGTETGARIARAKADSGRLAAMREAMVEGIRLEVRAARADRDAAEERFCVAVSALAQADEALRIVRERYGEGMAVMVELLGAEAARTQSQGARAAAARDLAVAQAALDLAVGRAAPPPAQTQQEASR